MLPRLPRLTLVRVSVLSIDVYTSSMRQAVHATLITPSRSLAFAAVTAAGCLWGTGFLFGKIALAELSVGHMVFYRLMFAAVGFVPFLVLYPVRIHPPDW